jgi:hypothetical protein
MKLHMVDSSQFNELDLTCRYFALADAYMSAAVVLLEQMNKGNWPSSYPNVCAFQWNFHQATELFYKGAIFHKTGAAPENTHSIPALKSKYGELYPKAEQQLIEPFGLEPPPEVSTEERNNLLRASCSEQERLKYPADVSGKRFEHREDIDPQAIEALLLHCQKQMRSILHSLGIEFQKDNMPHYRSDSGQPERGA